MVVVKRLVLVLLAGCGAGGTVVEPVIDLPIAGSPADPMPTLDEVELSVARAGAATPLVSATFVRGETLNLDGVPLEDDLVVHMVGRQAGSEIAYGRTCRFDIATGADVAAPHLWFSRTVTWAEVADPPNRDRAGGVAWTTAQDGVAIALGDGAGGPVTAVDLLDVGTATWSTVAALSPRTGGVLAPLGDGRAVVFGGVDQDGALHPLLETIDPYAPEAVRVQALTEPRLGLDGAAAATLAAGDVVVIGGKDATSSVDTVYALRVGEGLVVTARLLDARLTTARHGHTVTRLSDDVGAPVVVIGGVDSLGTPVAAAELYRPLREAFSTSFAATMLVPRSGHAAIRMPDGAILVVGGVDENGTAVRALELFSIDGGFIAAGELPADAGVIDPTLTPLPDGRVLLSGGRTSTLPADPPTASAFVLRLDPVDESIDIAATDGMEASRDRHTAAQLCDGTILVVGGSDDLAAERYQPPSASRR
jgi:hypothetical protein